VALAVLVALCFGVSFTVIKIGLHDVPPLLFAALRFTAAAIPGVFLIRPPITAPVNVILFGLFSGTLQFSLLFLGIAAGMSPGLASVVLQLQVVFTILIGRFLFGERLGRHQILGVGIAAAGIAMIGSVQDASANLWAVVLVVGGAFGWAAANAVTKRAGRVDMLAFVIWSSLVPPILLLAMSYLMEGPARLQAAIVGLTGTAIFSILFLAYPATVAGFGLWSWLIARHRLGTVAPFALLVPMFGLATSAIVLDERFGAWKIAAIALVMGGLAVNLLGGRMTAGGRDVPDTAPVPLAGDDPAVPTPSAPGNTR
jgi:O-acetylserine/cysteine efflux transporter